MNYRAAASRLFNSMIYVGCISGSLGGGWCSCSMMQESIEVRDHPFMVSLKTVAAFPYGFIVGGLVDGAYTITIPVSIYSYYQNKIAADSNNNT